MPIATVNGTTLFYEMQGEGAPLLMLPGLGMGGSYYRFGEPILRRHFRTILVDPRGIGQSGRGDREFSAEVWADDFAALLEHLGIAQAHVLGSSHGSNMAFALVDRHPRKAASLITVGGFSELNKLMEINFNMRIRMVTKLGMSEELADHISMWTMSPQFLDTEEGQKMAQANVAAVGRNDPDTYIALNRSILRFGRKLPGQEQEPLYTDRLRSFSVPTLAITGDSDAFIPARFSKIIAAAIPGASYAEIKDCGHIPFIETPEQVCALVTDFIRPVVVARTLAV